jgi:hypothetical protein
MRTLATQIEVDALREICRSHKLSYSIYPTDSGLSTMKIRYANGDELSPEIAFMLGQEMEARARKKRDEQLRLQLPTDQMAFQQLEDLLP